MLSDASDSLEEWFRLYRDRLRAAVALRLDHRLTGRIDPSDIIQEAFVEAAERVEQYKQDRRDPSKAGLTPYLWLRFLAVQRLLILHRRHLQSQNRNAAREIPGEAQNTSVTAAGLADFMIQSQTTPSEAAARVELLHLLHAALQELEAVDREVLALRHFEHLSNEEAAIVLHIEPAAASQRYYRALRRLRQKVPPALFEMSKL